MNRQILKWKKRKHQLKDGPANNLKQIHQYILKLKYQNQTMKKIKN